MVSTFRLVPLVSAICLGLAAGALFYIVFSREDARFALLAERMSSASRTSAPSRARSELAAATANPFVGSGGLAPATVQVDGLSQMPGRTAALLRINGKEARWVRKGETVDGVTFLDVKAGQAVIESRDGLQGISIGQAAPNSASTAGQAAATGLASGPGPVAIDQPPPGFKLPPPPASAPSALLKQESLRPAQLKR